MQAVTLLIVEDHPLFADGFRQMLTTLRPTWQVQVAASAAEALETFARLRPDLLIVDAGLPDDDGVNVVRQVLTLAPNVPQMIVSGRDDAAMRMRVRGSGARGFIPKSIEPSAMMERIDAVLAGGTAFDAGDLPPPRLTARQTEVLDLLAEGHSNKEIRYRLGIAERTVRAHLTELFQLLGVASRMQAALRARELGLIE